MSVELGKDLDPDTKAKAPSGVGYSAASEVVSAVTDEDDRELEALGYVPSFKREFSNLATVRSCCQKCSCMVLTFKMTSSRGDHVMASRTSITSQPAGSTPRLCGSALAIGYRYSLERWCGISVGE